MSYKYLEYPAQARRLADAGENLLEALADPAMDRGIVLSQLDAAASLAQQTDLRARFEAGSESGPAAPASAEDLLSGLLLELQSANTLMSSGLALNEHSKGSNSTFLNEAVAQIRSTSSDLTAQVAKSANMRFEAPSHPSASVEEALTLFRNNGDRTLGSIANGTEGIVKSAFAKLKEVDETKVSEAIQNLGNSFEIVAVAAKRIRQGLEKLKAVLDYLSSLVGKDAFADIKAKVTEIWQNFVGDTTLVRRIIGEPAARKRIDEYAALPSLRIGALDGVSREFALLEDKYQAKRKILNGLLSGLILGMSIVGALQFFGLWAAAPWLALAAAGAYAAILGTALLVGMNYTGARPLAGWIRGVCEIVQESLPPKSVS